MIGMLVGCVINGGLSVLFFCCWKKGKSSGNSDANVALMGEVGGSVEVEMEVEAPTLEVEVELEAPEIEVEVEIEAPEVEIEVEIEAPEVEIEIEAPDVVVEADLVIEADLDAPIIEVEAGGSSQGSGANCGLLWIILAILFALSAVSCLVYAF
jgi:hypothetical protein